MQKYSPVSVVVTVSSDLYEHATILPFSCVLTFLADNESIPTIRCLNCSEWHHRPCVSTSENKDESFVCRRCKVQTRVGLFDSVMVPPSTQLGASLPFIFWKPSKRLAFLRDASDRFEVMCKDPMDSVLIRLERDAKSIIKTNWFHTLDPSQDQLLIKNLRRSRGYDGNSLRDLLRVVRNKVSNFIHTSIYLLNFLFLYINRETTTKTSPTISKSNWGPCQKAFLNISRVGIQDCSLMCMKWLKRQVYIRNPCFRPISSCQKVELGSSLFILFRSILCFAFTNSLLSTCLFVF